MIRLVLVVWVVAGGIWAGDLAAQEGSSEKLWVLMEKALEQGDEAGARRLLEVAPREFLEAPERDLLEARLAAPSERRKCYLGVARAHSRHAVGRAAMREVLAGLSLEDTSEEAKAAVLVLREIVASWKEGAAEERNAISSQQRSNVKEAKSGGDLLKTGNPDNAGDISDAAQTGSLVESGGAIAADQGEGQDKTFEAGHKNSSVDAVGIPGDNNTNNTRRTSDSGNLDGAKVTAECVFIEERLLEIEAAQTAERLGWVRIRPGAEIPLPAPLGSEALVRVIRVSSPGERWSAHLSRSALPVLERHFRANDARPVIEGLSAGAYVFEMVAESSPVRLIRHVLVSDLSLHVVEASDGALCWVTLAGEPLQHAVVEWVQVDDGLVFKSGRTDNRGLVLFSHEKHLADNGAVVVRAAWSKNDGVVHHAELNALFPKTPELEREVFAHFVADRPVYRAGETLCGRILLRRVNLVPSDSAFSSNVPAVSGDTMISTELRYEVYQNSREIVSGRGHTDEFGVLPVEIEIPDDVDGPVMFTVRVVDNSGFEHVVLRRWIADVQAFVSPPVLVQLHAPEEYRRGEPLELGLEVRLAAGIPATGTRGLLTISEGQTTQVSEFITDERGRATWRVETQFTSGGPLHITGDVTAPDGQLIRVSRHLNPRRKQAQESSEGLHLELVSPPGGSTTAQDLVITGPPDAHVLILSGSVSLANYIVKHLDQNGRGVVRDPKSDFTRAGRKIMAMLSRDVPVPSTRYARTASIELNRGESPATLKLEAIGLRPEASPGETLNFEVAVRGADELGVEATLAVRVVDEALMRVVRDPTQRLAEALCPTFRGRALVDHFSEGYSAAYLVFGRLLQCGVPAPLSPWSAGGGAAPGGGGAYPGGSVAPGLREDFRATAAFFPSIRTDRDGRARLSIPLPHNLTTWRLEIFAVDRGLGHGTWMAKVETRKPLAVEAILPRGMRVGDQVVVTTPIVAQDNTQFPARLFSQTGGALDVSNLMVSGPAKLPTRELRAGREGRGTLQLTLEDQRGDPVDRVRRELPVTSDRSIRTTVAKGRVREDLLLERINPGSGEPTSARLVLMRGMAAQKAAARAWLEKYPFACAEQTSARLTPSLLDLVMGVGNPEDERRARETLTWGTRRLRELRHRIGGYAFWSSSGQCDLEMSTVVWRTLHILAAKPEILPRFLLLPQGDETLFRQARWEVAKWSPQCTDLGEGTPYVDRGLWLDVFSAALLWLPQDSRLREDVLQMTDTPEWFGSGALARAGLALHAAGEVQRADQILEVILERKTNGGGLKARGIFESRVVVLADTLRLVQVVRPESPLRDTLCLEIAGLGVNGRFENTAGTAAVYRALSAEFSQHGESSSSALVTVSDGETRREVEVPGDGQRVVLELKPGTAAVRVSGSPADGILAFLECEFSEAAAFVLPVVQPLRVERKILSTSSSSVSDDQTNGRVTSLVERGSMVHFEISIDAPRDASHLVMVCPIPAGFEVVRTGDDLLITDTDVVCVFHSVPDDGRLSALIRAVAAFEGEVIWPPVHVEGMYQSEIYGRSGGSRIKIRNTGETPLSGEIRTLLNDAHFEAVHRSLVSAVEKSRDTRELLRLIGKLLNVPGGRGALWFREYGLDLLEPRFNEPGVLEFWARNYGGDAWVWLLNGTRLERVFAALRGPELERLLRISEAFRLEAWGHESQIRAAASVLSLEDTLEQRLCAVVAAGCEFYDLTQTRDVLELRSSVLKSSRNASTRHAERYLAYERHAGNTEPLYDTICDGIRENLHKAFVFDGMLWDQGNGTQELEAARHLADLLLDLFVEGDMETRIRLASRVAWVATLTLDRLPGGAVSPRFRTWRDSLHSRLCEIREMAKRDLILLVQRGEGRAALDLCLFAPDDESRTRRELANVLLNAVQSSPRSTNLVEALAATLQGSAAETMDPWLEVQAENIWSALRGSTRHAAWNLLPPAARRRIPASRLAAWIRDDGVYRVLQEWTEWQGVRWPADSRNDPVHPSFRELKARSAADRRLLLNLSPWMVNSEEFALVAEDLSWSDLPGLAPQAALRLLPILIQRSF